MTRLFFRHSRTSGNPFFTSTQNLDPRLRGLLLSSFPPPAFAEAGSRGALVVVPAPRFRGGRVANKVFRCGRHWIPLAGCLVVVPTPLSRGRGRNPVSFMTPLDPAAPGIWRIRCQSPRHGGPLADGCVTLFLRADLGIPAAYASTAFASSVGTCGNCVSQTSDRPVP
jgi:hypothetical protein